MARAKRAEAALDALGSPVRRDIVRILASGPRPVGEIAAKLPVSRPAVSKHLAILTEAELVAHDRKGNRNVFRLHARGFDAARRWLEGFWDEALANFAREVERS
jgi:DNA-binding transcriptional ArsR family regulator